jgi:hypothetical protein
MRFSGEFSGEMVNPLGCTSADCAVFDAIQQTESFKRAS